MKIINKINSNPFYRPDIDGLRAIAVVAVIINHFNKELIQSGYLGVDIFFVISGFVITSSLAVRKSSNFNEFIISFYQRRLKRLIPALIFFVLITSILISFFNSKPFFELAVGFSSLFGFSNILLFIKSTDYFATSTLFNPFTHTWSLGVEEQFYLFFPLIIWFTGFSRKVKNSARNMILVLAPLTLISLFSFLFFYDNNQSAAYFLMPNRFWEMSIGSLIFLLQKKQNLIQTKISNISPNLVLILLIVSLFSPISYAKYATLWVVVLTSLLIITLKKGYFSYNILTKKNVVYVGLISYSLYLWHWGILAVSRNSIGIYWWSWPIQVLLIILCSILSYEYIEKKFKKFKFKSNKLISIIDFVKVIFFSAFLITSLGAAKFFRKIPNISYYSPKGISSVSRSEKCMRGDLELCFKRENSIKSTFSIGDSHLMNYAPSLRSSLSKVGYKSYFWGDTRHIRDIFSSNCTSTTCYLTEINQIKNILSKNDFNKNDIFIYSLSRNRLYLDEKIDNPTKFYKFRGFSRRGLENKSKINILDSAIRSLVEFVSDKGGKFILIDDLPLACGFKEWHANLIPCFVSKEISLQDREPLSNLFKKISNDYVNVFYIDPHDFICESEMCIPKKNNIPLYKDSSPHLSIDAKYILEPFFSQEFNLILDD